MPTNLYFAWTLPTSDKIIQDAVRESTRVLEQVASQLGERDAAASVYSNYAIFDTPLQDIYGGKVARLKAIKANVDPQNVMGLAGGFKF